MNPFEMQIVDLGCRMMEFYSGPHFTFVDPRRARTDQIVIQAVRMKRRFEKARAEKAAGWGLIHKAVADDQLMTEATALAERLARGPTVALGVMRRNIAEAMDGTYAQALAREAAGQRLAGGTGDAREGAMAFLQKRKAEFRGA